MPQPVIDDLDFDEDVESHLARHGIYVDDIYEMLELGEWVRIVNKRKHSHEHLRFVGRLADGRLITVVLESTATYGIWRPVTAWDSNEAERTLYAKGMKHRNG
jgi:uncharacterized DUF497 family protein